MKCNVGKKDKLVRLVLGIAIIAFGAMEHSDWAMLGLIPLVTGIFSFCPMYSMLKISTK